MVRAYRTQCVLCWKTVDTYETICPECSQDHSGLSSLYTKIVTQRPHLRTKSPLEVFTALWADWNRLKNESDNQPDASGKRPGRRD